jgi:hypothetical protein
MKETTHPIVELIYNGYSFWPKKKFTYAQFDITIAVTGNPNRDEVDPYTKKSNLFLF